MAHLHEPKARTVADILGKGPMMVPLGVRTATCQKHGEYESTGSRFLGAREIWSGCPACEEERKVEERQAEERRRAELQLARIENMMNRAAIPARFRELLAQSVVLRPGAEARSLTREEWEEMGSVALTDKLPSEVELVPGAGDKTVLKVNRGRLAEPWLCVFGANYDDDRRVTGHRRRNRGQVVRRVATTDGSCWIIASEAK